MGKKTVLVTGGAGFIGSHLVERLVGEGRFDVRVVDNYITGRRENLAPWRSLIDLLEGDIRDPETAAQAVEGVEYVLHQAALPSVPRSVKTPCISNDVNVGGTLRLLEAAVKAGVKRVVFASSSSVYGADLTVPKREDMPTVPCSPYAVSKLACEHYARVFTSLYGIETLAIRYFNVFGPRQDPSSQYSGVIAKFALAALSGREVAVHGDGLQARDFTYVDNVVDANFRALEAPSVVPGVVNVACGQQISLLDVLHTLEDLVGAEIPYHLEPERPGDVRFSQADIGRATSLLGYRPIVGLREGLRRTLEATPAESTSVDRGGR